MYREYVVLLLPVLAILIYLVKRGITSRSISAEYLVVLFFVLCIPFGYGFSFWGIYGMDGLPGTLGLFYRFGFIQITAIASILIMPRAKLKIGNNFFSVKRIVILLLLLLISFFNPNNQSILASAIGAYSLLSVLFLSFIINNSFDYRNTLSALIDGLVVISVIQLILSVCFPVFDLRVVTTLFHDDVGRVDLVGELAHRNGAVGTFDHPGKLGLFMSINAILFFSFFLNQVKRSFFGLLLVIAFIIIILTVSRTSLFFVLIVFTFMFFVSRYPKVNFLNPFILSGVTLLLVIVTGAVIMLTPLKEHFLSSNALEMFDARLAHFRMAFGIFEKSPLIGVGINSHLAFAREFISSEVLGTALSEDFAYTNPIHNIHLIVLAEFGIIGFICWISFLFIELKGFRERFIYGQDDITKSLNLACVGILFLVIFYGVAGWSPFTENFLSYLIFIVSFVHIVNARRNKFDSRCLNFQPDSKQ